MKKKVFLCLLDLKSIMLVVMMIDEDGDDHGRHDDGNDGGNCQLCR